MDELVAFVRAQLDEDERMARGASDWPWEATISLSGEQGDVQGVTSAFEDYCCSAEDATHIARWDPARVLAKVKADRQLLNVVFAYEAKIDGEWGCCHSANAIAEGRCEEIPPGEIHALRLLAQPYAGCEGWREEWRA